MTNTTNPYTIPDTGPMVVMRGGRPVSGRLANADAAFEWLLRHQGQSVAYALTDGGYSVQRVPVAAWSVAEAAELREQSRAVFARHDHNISDHDPLTRENCGACCLGGYTPRGGWGDGCEPGPNWAGWERAYVQAGRPIKRRWAETFRARANEQTPYGEALRMDLETFGWPAIR